MCKADREVRPIFFNKTHYLHCTYLSPEEAIEYGLIDAIL